MGSDRFVTYLNDVFSISSRHLQRHGHSMRSDTGMFLLHWLIFLDKYGGGGTCGHPKRHPMYFDYLYYAWIICIGQYNRSDFALYNTGKRLTRNIFFNSLNATLQGYMGKRLQELNVPNFWPNPLIWWIDD